MDSLQTLILKRMRQTGRGAVYTPKDFLDLGTRDAIDQALSRLARHDELQRLGRGLYYYPRINLRFCVTRAAEEEWSCGEVEDAMDADFVVDGFEAGEPEAGGFGIFLRFVAVFALEIVVGLFILGAGLFSDHRHNHVDGERQENTIRPNGPLEATRDLPKDYSFDVRQAAAGITYEMTMPAQTSAAPATRPSGPTVEELAAAAERKRLAELREKLLEQQRKEMEQALDSSLLFVNAKPTEVKPLAPPPSATAVPPVPPAQSSSPPPALSIANDPNAIAPTGIRQNMQREKEEFLTKGNDVEPYLQKPLLQPISTYELKAGTFIPGALITAINTDLPGEVIGQVTENVYDTKSGKYLLVPQGTRLLGKYSSLVSNGQNRALIVWTRLIMPNGNSIVLEGMPGTDQAGQAGLKDKVDYHLGQLAGAVGLTTAIAYAGNLARSPSERNGDGTGNSSADVIGDSVAQQANRVGEKVIDRELDVQPTITIRAGWKFNVLVNKDMVLARYDDPDVKPSRE